MVSCATDDLGKACDPLQQTDSLDDFCCYNNYNEAIYNI